MKAFGENEAYAISRQSNKVVVILTGRKLSLFINSINNSSPLFVTPSVTP